MANLPEGSATRAACTQMKMATLSWSSGWCMEPVMLGQAAARLGPTLTPADPMQVVKCCASFSKDPRSLHECAISLGTFISQPDPFHLILSEPLLRLIAIAWSSGGSHALPFLPRALTNDPPR